MILLQYVFIFLVRNLEMLKYQGAPSARLNTGFTGIGLEAQLKEWPPRFLKRQNYKKKKEKNNNLKYFHFSHTLTDGGN